VKKKSIWHKLYHGETQIDFVGRTKLWFTISAVVILIGIVSLLTRSLNFGIDFDGGVVWEVSAPSTSVAEARDALDPLGLGGAQIQTLQSDTGTRLRVESEFVGTEKEGEVASALAELTGTPVDDVSLNSVGPSWGEEISRKAIRALVFFLIAITIYITFRFEFKMAVPTLAALVHDIFVTIGIYSLTGFEVTPATVVAVLTILGYSIYDGIVVFDKVDENTRLVSAGGKMTYGEMVNLSLNQVLMRSLNTSITALLPIASLLIVGSFVLGATTLQEFALALVIGLGAGAYSSIFIASPLLAILKEREPRYRELRRRLEARAGRVTVTSPAAAAAQGLVGDTAADAEKVATAAPASTTTTTAAPAKPLYSASHPPRPRKKTKRR
jgi:preprotein translocase subunit SecF